MTKHYSITSFKPLDFLAFVSVKNLHRREVFVTFLREKSKRENSIQLKLLQKPELNNFYSNAQINMKFISDQHFENINFAKDGIEQGEYTYCTFKQCNFADVSLSSIQFIDSEFEGCNLSNAKINNTSFQKSSFDQCKMLGMQFDACTDFGFSIHCKNSILQHSIFYKMDLRQCSFDHCNLSEVDLGEANLSGILLSNCNLENAIFGYTNLEKTNLLGTVNFNIDPDSNKLKGAKFSASEVIRLLSKYGLVIE